MPIQGAVMPYASNIPSRGSGLAQGMSNLLNLKQAFADAVRKNAWDKERTGMEQRGAGERLLMGQYGAAPEGTSPGGIPVGSMPGVEIPISGGGQQQQDPVNLARVMTQVRQLSQGTFGEVNPQKFIAIWNSMAPRFGITNITGEQALGIAQKEGAGGMPTIDTTAKNANMIDDDIYNINF
ncbi:MAG: hypothetical protein ABIB11_03440 [Candidatus Omnitrophota bacterium]